MQIVLRFLLVSMFLCFRALHQTELILSVKGVQSTLLVVQYINREWILESGPTCKTFSLVIYRIRSTLWKLKVTVIGKYSSDGGAREMMCNK